MQILYALINVGGEFQTSEEVLEQSAEVLIEFLEADLFVCRLRDASGEWINVAANTLHGTSTPILVRAMTATREVETAIRGIQQHTRTNVEEVDAAAATINETTGLARLSSEALAEIVALVDLTTDQIGAIAAASEQQSSSSEEINTAIEEVRRISGETSDSMRQAAQSVESLSAQAGALEKLIDDMRAGVAQVA